MPIPRVVGVRLTGQLREGVTPTDVVLTVTELLRKRNVVDAFVEYFGEGYGRLSVPDRATLGNMSPEYGATVGFSPVDQTTLNYLRDTGRDEAHVAFVERYTKAQDLFVLPGSAEPSYSEVLEVDLGQIEPSIAGPRNPDERRTLKSVPSVVSALIEERRRVAGGPAVSASPGTSGTQVVVEKKASQSSMGLSDGSVIIAAITSCTNTSNPTVMIGAGLVAKRAAMEGLAPKPYVKCSLAPGSTVVTDYLNASGLLPFLDKMGFNLVGYGCTTCIGNSGPLSPEVEKEVKDRNLYAVAVLSGNRNFDGRIHPLAKGSFLMSPMMVVAYALAGRIDFDFERPLGKGRDGKEVYLRDLWPSLREIKETVERSLDRELYRRRYADALVGDERWKALGSGGGETYGWEDSSTYIREPPWFEEREGELRDDIREARVLAVLGDKITTDHISPAGTIPLDSPAGRYLKEHGVEMIHFSTYGSRRGNHEVMSRGGFANIRLRNLLADGREGGYTRHLPSGEVVSIHDASVRYARDGTPLLILAGKQYGSGSSRDWAAKAPKMLGVRAVIAESFERIHRSNLVAMGILPLEFQDGETRERLGLDGTETYTIEGMQGLSPGSTLNVTARSRGTARRFRVKARIDNNAEMRYYDSGGVLPYVLHRLTDRA